MKKHVKTVSKKAVKQAVAKTKAVMPQDTAVPPPRELSEQDRGDLMNRVGDMTRILALLETADFLLDFVCQDRNYYPQLRPGEDAQAAIQGAATTVRRIRRETRKMLRA